MKSQIMQSTTSQARRGAACRAATPLQSHGDDEERRKKQDASSLRVKPVYTLRDFCDEFGICRSSAYEEIRAGRLRAFKIGSSTRIAGEDALAWRDLYRGARAA